MLFLLKKLYTFLLTRIKKKDKWTPKKRKIWWILPNSKEISQHILRGKISNATSRQNFDYHCKSTENRAGRKNYVGYLYY